jgi:hypothetical protein
MVSSPVIVPARWFQVMSVERNVAVGQASTSVNGPAPW